ncbi:unnamed protein product [Lathyrus sativus]|nr:unnamed protein product [Lathyrus sativus]
MLQHFPKSITKTCLGWNQKDIELVDANSDRLYHAKVHSARCNKKIVKTEKFISKGWYQFAKHRQPRRGDKLGFSITKSGHRLYVVVLNRCL